MNRELKFRVWHKEFNRFLGKEEYCLDLDGKLIFVELLTTNSVSLKSVNPDLYVIQQFTGLKDINQKDIYEGDIIKWTDTNFFDGNWGERDTISTVSYETGSYYPVSEFIEDDYREIIGNIFQNPDLLK
jgi:uncharacterized phage protein (TIGR01671 family)